MLHISAEAFLNCMRLAELEVDFYAAFARHISSELWCEVPDLGPLISPDRHNLQLKGFQNLKVIG